MALLFIDSFDHYTTASQKWTVAGRNGISAGNGRLLAAGYTESNSVAGTGGSMTKILPSTYATLIVGAGIKFTGTGLFRWLFQEGATTHIELTVNGSGFIEVRRGAGGTLLATGITPLVADTYYHLEVKVNVHDSTGSVEVRINEAVDCTFTGDTRNGGATGLMDRFSQSTPYGGTFGNGFAYFDDLFIMSTAGSYNNDFKGDCRVEALYPDANGNSSQFVGSDGNSTDNYALVDEKPPNSDTDYVQSSTVGEKDTYNYGSITSTTGNVHGVQVLPFARKTDAGSRSIASIARSNGVEGVGADKALAETYAYHPQIFEENPDTTDAWTIAEVNAAEFGVGVTV
jgi:hypothetical protein